MSGFLGVVVDDDWTDDAAPVDCVVTRRAHPANDGHGRTVPAGAQVLTMSLSVQPIMGRSRKDDGNGAETMDRRLAFTTDARLLDVENEQQIADVVTIVDLNGTSADWKVVVADHRTERGGVFTAATLERIKAP